MRWLAAVAFGLARGPPEPSEPDALKAAQAQLNRDELTQQTLLAQKHSADKEVLRLSAEDRTLREELSDTRSRLVLATTKVTALEKADEDDKTLAGSLAEARGNAVVEASDSAADDRSELNAAKSMAVLLHQATKTQTALIARAQRLSVEALQGQFAAAAATGWRRQAQTVEQGLSGQLASTAKLQKVVDAVQENEHRAEEARKKEKAFLVSRLKSETAKNKQLQDEIATLRKDGTNVTHADHEGQETFQETRAELFKAVAQKQELQKELKTAEVKEKKLEDDNTKAAVALRSLTTQLHRERNQRSEEPTPEPKKRSKRVNRPSRHSRHHDDDDDDDA
jgi:hypothetical protein